MATIPREHERIDKLCQQFVNLVEKALTGQALASSANGDLSRAQYEGLRYVGLHPDCCIKDLAKGLAVSHPAAVKLVERLAEKALIGREVRDEDRRVVRLAVTREGLGLLEDVRARREHAFHLITRAMLGGEIDALADSLDTFIRKALEAGLTGDKICLHCGLEHADECPLSRQVGAAA